MEPYTVSSRILTLHRAFAAYTSQRLQELGLNFGQMYFILYVGKHPDCTPSELTKELIWTGDTPSAALLSWSRTAF